MKIIKTKKYAQQQVSYQQVWDEQKARGPSDMQAAEAVLDIVTNGMWAAWDQGKIDQAIQTIIKQFGNKL